MTIQRIEYYEVYGEFSDDGRGNDFRVVGSFSDKHIANKYAIGRGPWGTNLSIRKVILNICDTIQDLETLEKNREIEEALNKLTTREKELLNLQ